MMRRWMVPYVFLICVATATETHIRISTDYYIPYKTLEINCSSEIAMEYFVIQLDNQQISSVILNSCNVYTSDALVPCNEKCTCAVDNKSVSYRYNVSSENDTLKFKCISSNKISSTVLETRKASKPENASINATTSVIKVKEGQPIQPISCTVHNCIPDCTYRWTGPNMFETNESILHIVVVQRTNNGTFTCSVENVLGKLLVDVEILVQYGPNETIINPKQNNYILNERDELGPISCSAKCNPFCNITWKGPGISPTLFNLTITNISRNNAGQFICTVENDFGKLEEGINVTVNYEPFQNVTIVSDPTPYVKENSTMKLMCTVYGGNPLANISFFCENREVKVLVEKGSSNITAFLEFIANRNDNDHMCTCKASHNIWVHAIEVKHKIVVHFPPNPVILFEGISNSTYFYEFDLATVKCLVSGGNPLADIELTCGSIVKGKHGINGSTSFSSISMNVTRNLNSDACICIGHHALFVSNKTRVVIIQVLYPPGIPILISTPSDPFLEGQLVELTCNVSEGNPPISKYEWYINNKLQMTASDKNVFIFDNVSKHDNNKTISCRVHNMFTEKKNISISSDPMIFNVEFVPRIWYISKNRTINEGMTMTIICKACGNPLPYVNWRYNATNITDANKSEAIWNLPDADRSIQGTYICNAYSMSSHGLLTSSLSTEVIVNYPPDVSIYVFGRMNTGGSVTLVCNATGQPSIYNYTGWTQAYRTIDIRNSIQNNGSHLFLRQLSYRDIGKYTCYVNNGIKNRNKTLEQHGSLEVKVSGAPIRIPELSEAPVFSTEQYDSLNATISFFSFPNITSLIWYNLTSNTMLSFSKSIDRELHIVEIPHTLYSVKVNLTEFCYNASLIIHNFQPHHSGIYALEVSNSELHKVNFTLRAVVSGPPERPSNVSIEVVGTSILVNILPGFNGGHAQKLHINYTICYPDNIMQTTFNDSGRGWQLKQIDNLEPSTKYCLSVFSSNRKGFSSYNDTRCCEEFVIITDQKVYSKQQGSISAVVGGSIGSLLAIVAIIGVTTFLCIRRNGQGGDRQRLKCKTRDSCNDDGDEDELKDNPLYGSAFNSTTMKRESTHSVVNQLPRNAGNWEKSKTAKQEKENCKENVQLETIYENSNNFLDFRKEALCSNQNTTGEKNEKMIDKMNKNKDGLVYAELEFAPQVSGKQFVIRGQENKTNYAFIDLTQKADPLPSDDED